MSKEETEMIEALKENPVKKVTREKQNGAGARNRTEMPLRAGDFESPASTSFTTPARSSAYRRGYEMSRKMY